MPYYHAIGYAAYKEWYWVSQLVIIVLEFSLIFGLVFRNTWQVSVQIFWSGRLLAAYLGIQMGHPVLE